MDGSQQLQLEAIKLLQQWSIWLIGICSGLLTAGSFLTAKASASVTARDLKIMVVAMGITIVSGVFLVGALPAITQHISVTAPLVEYPLGIKAPGIYSYKYLGFIPLWVLVSAQRYSFLVAVFWILRSLIRAFPQR